MIIRRAVLELTFLVTHNLTSTVGNHFIGIHVDRCARTSLYHIGHKVLVHLTINKLTACLCHRISHFITDFTELTVGFYSSQFDVSNRNNIVWIITHTLA